MNKIKVEIYNEQTDSWEDYSQHVPLPFKYSNLLDEQLDEAEIQLQYITTSIFEPLTRVKIKIINSLDCKFSNAEFNKIKTQGDDAENELEYIYDNGKISIIKEMLMLVANDQATERPIGSGKYNHNLYLIEFTKFLEGFVGDSITFTNALGNSFDNAVKDSPYLTFSAYESFGNNPTNRFIGDATSVLYPSLFEKDEPINIETDPETFFSSIKSTVGEINGYTIRPGDGVFITTLTGGNVYSQYIEAVSGALVQKIGNNSVEYLDKEPGSNVNWQPYTLDLTTLENLEISYKLNSGAGAGLYAVANMIVTNNRLPVKKWTIADVISRTLETIEVLKGFNKGQVFPRFWLEGTRYAVVNGRIIRGYNTGLARRLDKIIAPEFSFTKMTLRELLQQVGGFIHGEPRISGLKKATVVNSETGTQEVQYYEITFDEYGQTEKSYLATKSYPYITKQENININEYCTSIDSSIDNLVNSLNYAQGVILDPPYSNKYKAIRTTSANVRLGENNNSIIETVYPIFKVGLREQVNCQYGGNSYDITPFVYSYADYQLLSSYSGSYPYVKAYALYYVPGEKNIRGLFFQNPHAISPIFTKFAIANILTQVSGSDVDFDSVQDVIDGCGFSVSYIPFSKDRVLTTKPTIKKGLPRTLVYNQNSNVTEAKFLGENLKGIISRLGNVEKSVTYLFSMVNEIPKQGLKYNDDYYISSISVEVLPTCFKATLGLSKDFNRLSEYVSLNSEIRMWEVSERQSQERRTVITDYVVIQETETPSNEPPSSKFIPRSNAIAKILLNSTRGLEPRTITGAKINTYSKSGDPLVSYDIGLPVVSTALGNSMSFSFGFEDNYSAGQRLTGESNVGAAGSSYYGDYVPYGDYYGRVYSFDIGLYQSMRFTSGKYMPIADTPGDGLLQAKDICYQKDNREIPSITYNIQFVSDDSVVIGSGLASNCLLVNKNPSNVKFVLLNKQINKISNISLTEENIVFSIGLNNLFTITNQNYITLPTKTELLNLVGSNKVFGEDYFSWALITEFSEDEILVANEDGKSVTQTIFKGGEILLGQNKEVSGQNISFIMKSDIYKKF